MKIKNRIGKISLISLILISVIGMINTCYGIELEKVANVGVELLVSKVAGGTLVGLLSTVIQIGALSIATFLNLIVSVVVGLHADDGFFISNIRAVLFNKADITTANFFPILNKVSSSSMFTEKIGEYYLFLRNIAIALLLFILLYIGIRMAISTVAEQEAKYKKMLQNWAVSLALVFVLHYIIILTFVVNNTLVDILYKYVESEQSNGAEFLSSLALINGGVKPIIGWPEVIVYVMITVATVAFLITYIKRVITLGFLIIISPLITVTYSIDKIGDGKSQALNTWLKEFIFTVLIQPFHCIIYIVFVHTAVSEVAPIGDGMVNSVLAVASVMFMMKAEGIIKKIFGLKADSMGDAMKSGTMALGLATGLLKGMGKGDNGKVPDMKGNNAAKNMSKNAANQAGNAAANQAGNAAANQAGNAAANQAGNAAANQAGNAAANQAGNAAANQAGNAAANQAGNAAAQTQNAQQNKITEALKNAGSSAWKTLGAPAAVSYLQRYTSNKNAKDLMAGTARFALSNGAAAFGAIAGAGLGDAGTAVSSAMAAKGAVDGLYGEFVDKGVQEQKAEENQQVFAGAYNDYLQEYMKHNPDASVDDVMFSIEDLLSKSGSELKTEYEKDMYKQASLLQETGEALGYKDGTTYIRDTIRKINREEIKPGDDYVQKTY